MLCPTQLSPEIMRCVARGMTGQAGQVQPGQARPGLGKVQCLPWTKVKHAAAYGLSKVRSFTLRLRLQQVCLLRSTMIGTMLHGPCLLLLQATDWGLGNRFHHQSGHLVLGSLSKACVRTFSCRKCLLIVWALQLASVLLLDDGALRSTV